MEYKELSKQFWGRYLVIIIQGGVCADTEFKGIQEMSVSVHVLDGGMEIV